MTDLLEALMILCFGLSWPISIRKSWTSRTAKGKSLFFEVFLLIGYIFGIARKCILFSQAMAAGQERYILKTVDHQKTQRRRRQNRSQIPDIFRRGFSGRKEQKGQKARHHGAQHCYANDDPGLQRSHAAASLLSRGPRSTVITARMISMAGMMN